MRRMPPRPGRLWAGRGRTRTGWRMAGWRRRSTGQPSRSSRAFDRWHQLYQRRHGPIRGGPAATGAGFHEGGQEPARTRSRMPRSSMREARRQLELLTCQNVRAGGVGLLRLPLPGQRGLLAGLQLPRPAGARVRLQPQRGRVHQPAAFPGHQRVRAGQRDLPRRARSTRSTGPGCPHQDPEKRFVRAKLCLSCGYLHEGEAVNDEKCGNCGGSLESGGLYVVNLLEMPTEGTNVATASPATRKSACGWGTTRSTNFRLRKGRHGRVAAAAGERTGGWRARDGRGDLAPTGPGLCARGHAVAHQPRLAPPAGSRLPAGPEARASGLGQNEIPGKTPGSAARARRGSQVAGAALRARHGERTAGLPRAGRHLSTACPSCRACNMRWPAASRSCSRSRRASWPRNGSARASTWASCSTRGLRAGWGCCADWLEEPSALAAVARQALELLHFDPETGDDLRPADDRPTTMACSRACYECLMSYYNQRDHRLLNRHAVRDCLAGAGRQRHPGGRRGA